MSVDVSPERVLEVDVEVTKDGKVRLDLAEGGGAAGGIVLTMSKAVASALALRLAEAVREGG